MDDPAIWIGLIAAVFGGYMAACNFALRHFSRSRLSDLLEERKKGDRFESFLKKLDALQLMTASLRTAMNLSVLLAAMIFFQQHLAEAPPWRAYVIAFLAAGLLVSVLAVAIPISIARYHPEPLLAASMPLLTGLLWILSPIVHLLHAFDPIVRRITGASKRQNGDDALTDEVMSVVEVHEESAGVDEDQKEMLEAVFEFRSTTAGEIMTPRIEIEGIDVNASLEDVKQRVQEIGHSRIPIYDDNLDKLQGVLYVKDLIPFVGSSIDGSFKLRKLLREPMMVPESKPVRELLTEFKKNKVHLAIVLDEYGGTAGLVTIEDILEEIVGDIQDEYEPAEETTGIEREEEGAVLVDARMHVDDVNDELDLGLPEDADYDTVGGFVFSTLGHIPEVGESFEWKETRITVTDAERTRVNRVRIQWPQKAEVEYGDGGK